MPAKFFLTEAPRADGGGRLSSVTLADVAKMHWSRAWERRSSSARCLRCLVALMVAGNLITHGRLHVLCCLLNGSAVYRTGNGSSVGTPRQMPIAEKGWLRYVELSCPKYNTAIYSALNLFWTCSLYLCLYKKGLLSSTKRFRQFSKSFFLQPSCWHLISNFHLDFTLYPQVTPLIFLSESLCVSCFLSSNPSVVLASLKKETLHLPSSLILSQ